jgi:hypothetical protein
MPDAANDTKDAKAKATKRIVQGVQFHDRLYAAGDEDDLENRLTPEAYERLTKLDPPALEGDWNPSGTGDGPMPNSDAALEAAGLPGRRTRAAAPAGPHPAAAENERLKAENARLKAEAAGGSGASAGAAGAAGHGARRNQ